MPGLQAVDRNGNVVLMGAGQTQPGGQLRLIVPGLVFLQGPGDILHRTQRVLHGFHGLIRQSQLLPLPGALPVGPPGTDRQRLDIPGPIADQHRPHLTQPVVEIRQGVQQLGIFVAVPQDPGLVVIQPPVFRQGLGIPGPQLAQGLVHEPPPGRRPLPDEKQVLRGEKHRVQHLGQVAAVFGGHTVDGHLPPPSPGQLNLRFKFPLPGPDLSHQPGPVRSEANKLPIRMGPGTAAAGQVYDGLQQVGLSLGIFAVYDVAASVEGQLLAVVIAEALQQQAVNLHTARRSAAPGPPPRRRGGASFPAWCTPRR